MKNTGFLRACRRMTAAVLLAALWIAFLPTPARAADSRYDSDRVIVSLGDSYSSGEGNEPFYDQDLPPMIRADSYDWLAHRSTVSWPGQLTLDGVSGVMERNRGTHWFFAAASGAQTKDILGKQKKTVTDPSVSASMSTGVLPPTVDKYLPPQIDIFDTLDAQGLTADYVTLTLGGNDVGFSKVIEICATKSTYLYNGDLHERMAQSWNQFTKKGGCRDALRQVYHDIAGRAPEAHIIVVGYPPLLDAKGFFISQEEADTVNEQVGWFNDRIAELVEECAEDGLHISFVSVYKKFEGHEAYTKKPYIKEIIFLPQSQDLALGVGSAYSMHPNKDGLEKYREAVQKEIKRLEDTWDDWHTSAPEPQADLVEDAWSGWCDYSFSAGQTYRAEYHLPRINIEGPQAEAVNEEILARFATAMEDAEKDFTDASSYPPEYAGISYRWSEHHGVLSLLIEWTGTMYDGTWHELYTVSTSFADAVDSRTVVQKSGMDYDTYRETVRQALGSAFWDVRGSATTDDVDSSLAEALEQTVSEENVSSARPFFDENGHLCILGSYYYPAGGGRFDTVVDLETFSVSPYYQPTLGEPWAIAYADLLEEQLSNPDARFQLVYLAEGSSDCPQLVVAEGWAHMFGVKIYTWSGGSVLEVGVVGSWGEFQFDPDTGIIGSTYAGMGYYDTVLYTFDGEHLVERYAAGGEIDGPVSYARIDGQEVESSRYGQVKAIVDGYGGNYATLGYSYGHEVTAETVSQLRQSPYSFVALGHD